MTLQLIDKKFLVVPAREEMQFTGQVINNYFNIATFKKGELTTEGNVSDEMIDALNAIASLEIFEDTHSYQKLSDDDPMLSVFEDFTTDHFDFFMHDIVLAFENTKLSYYLEANGTYHNMPNLGVW